MEVWNTVILIHPFKFVAELVTRVWLTSAKQPNHVGSLHWEGDPLRHSLTEPMRFAEGNGMHLYYHQCLTEMVYLTTTCCKTLLSFGLVTYCNLHPVGFGTTVLFAIQRSEGCIGSPGRARCKSRYKSKPSAQLQESSCRFNDAEPSCSVKRKQTSARRFALYHWSMQDFSHQLQQGNWDGLSRSTT